MQEDLHSENPAIPNLIFQAGHLSVVWLSLPETWVNLPLFFVILSLHNSIFAEGLDDFKTLDAVERLKFLLAENINWNNGCYYVDAYRKTKDIFDRIQEYKTRAIEAARTGVERSGLYPTVPLYDFLATIYNVNGDYKDSGQK